MTVKNKQKYIQKAVDATEQLLNLTLDDQRFEHLGDGVIAKKPDQSGPPDELAAPTTTEKVGDSATTLQTPMSGSSGEESQSSDESSTEAYGEASATEGIDPVLSGGLNGTHDEALVDVGMDLESRNSPDDVEQAALTTTPSPASLVHFFLNSKWSFVWIKRFILI